MDDRDIITAASVDEFPTSVGSAKENIVKTLQKIQTEFEGNGWAAIKIIAKESGTSDVYTRNVIGKLMEDHLVERGQRGKKVYYRLMPAVKPEVMAEPETPEE
tara:strand:- start:682 stop:990 length:309 start_codon:yes stop_codon:yes gene_type:complete